MTQDLRYGWRQLRKTPVFTLTALLSLGLGISASVTMFSAFRAVFLRSLPYRDAERIVEVGKLGSHGYTPATTLADLAFLQWYAKSFESAATYGFFKSATLSGVSEPADLWVRDVSKELFPLLGARPLVGRTFAASDFEPGAPQAVVLGYETWQKYFHADAAILGHAVFLDRQSYVAIGVMPKSFNFPRAGIGAWLPGRTAVGDLAHSSVAIVARLRPGVSFDEARTELNRLLTPLLQTYASSERDFRLTLEDVATRDVKSYRGPFLLLLGATGFLVLLACLNVANLLLARAAARRDEFAVRAALGAGRMRLIGQVLTESVMLGGIGGALGLGLAFAGHQILLRFLPPYLAIPRLDEAALDLAVLGFAVLLTFVAALVFGIAPALALSASKLSESDRGNRGTARTGWGHSALIMAEIGLALMLFAGAVLMARGFVRLANVNAGFRTAHILTGTVPPDHAARLTRAQLVQRYSAMLQAARNIPGVREAALTSYLPLGKISVQLQVYLPGVSSTPFQMDYHAVSAQYLDVMGIPLLQGRFFSKVDPNLDHGAVVINQALAKRYWPGREAIGQHLSSRPAPSTPDLTVIGVVGNTRQHSLSGEPVPEFYEAFQQYLGPAVGTTLVLRTLGNPGSVSSSLRQAIQRFDPEQVLENERTMEATVEQSIATPRFYTLLLSVFALLALILTLVGVYGVASYGLSLRTREFAIRMALGAERHQVIAMIVQQGFVRAAAGIGAGAIGAWSLARFLSGLVYGIPARDPASLGIAAAVLLAGALSAYYLPARRNTKMDPAAVLRQE